MKFLFFLSYLISTSVYAAIPDGASTYSCHLISSDGSYSSAPTYGFSEKDATLRIALLKLNLNERGEFVRRNSQSSEVIVDIQCVVSTTEAK